MNATIARELRAEEAVALDIDLIDELEARAVHQWCERCMKVVKPVGRIETWGIVDVCPHCGDVL